MTTPTDYTPSPAMVHAVMEGLPDAAINADAEEAIYALRLYLSDPKNAEDAKAWAEATMDVGAFSLGSGDNEYLFYADQDQLEFDMSSCTPLYRVRSES